MQIASLARLVSTGTWGGQAAAPLAGDLAVTATGTTSQANSYAIGAATEIVKCTTVAAASGVRLPVPYGVNDTKVVTNAGANALLLYPATGGIINGLAANASLSIPVGKAALCVAVNATDWVVFLSA